MQAVSKIIKELSNYSFSDIEVVVIKKILARQGILEVKNKLINSIIQEKINKGVELFFDSRKIDVDINFLEKLYETSIPHDDQKINGAYYTPVNIASFITNKTIENIGTICDPACGSGVFLIEATKLLKNKYKLTYSEIFRKYIFGVDLLPYAIKRSKIILSLLAIVDGEDKEFSFNLFIGDALNFNWEKQIDKFEGFSYVIGNPPYVRTKNLDPQVKRNLKKWHTANYGNVDLYIPFFELATKITIKSGKIGYITPSTYLTSVNAKLLRNFLYKNKYLETVIDFNGWQIFEGATTYTCITILNKMGKEVVNCALVDKIEKIYKLDEIRLCQRRYDEFTADEWRIINKDDAENIFKLENVGSPLFKYVNKFVTGLATLNNDLFLLEDNGLDYLIKEFGGKKYKIERSITKKIIKPNKIKTIAALMKNNERIIYPYIQQEIGRSIIMQEYFLKQKFPNTYEYLCAIKKELSLRDKGTKKYEAWYAYGRTQGLNNFGKKIILPMMGNRPSFIVVDEEDTLIYCGYALFPKLTQDFVLLEKILNSKIFWYYLKKTSKNYSGGFKSFAKNYIKNFAIPNFTNEEKNKLEKIKNAEHIERFLVDKYQLANFI